METAVAKRNRRWDGEIGTFAEDESKERNERR